MNENKSSPKTTWLVRAQKGESIPAPQPCVPHFERDAALELAALSEPQARGFLARDAAFELQVLPLQIQLDGNQKIFVVAIGVDETPELRQHLSFATGYPQRFMRVDPVMLRDALTLAYSGDESALLKSVTELAQYGDALGARVRLSAPEDSSDSNEVTRFVTKIIEYAAAHRATDIHFSARKNGAFVQLRIQGELRYHDTPLSSLDAYRQLVSRIKILARLDITDRAAPQDGSFTFSVDGRVIDIRVSTLPALHGENVVLRLFGGEGAPELDELGIEQRLLAHIHHVCDQRVGAILVAGPTGSGKTSTLYAIATRLLRAQCAVATIEDPVEIPVEGMVQSSIDEARGYGYAQAFRAVLRQDPDVILIGEMREFESARAALDAALSGHLVLSTVHGGSVADVLNRLTYFGVERALAAQSLRIVIAQRLANTLCAACRVFDLRAANVENCDVYQSVGCRRCGQTGFSGKVLIAEALVFDDTFRELFAESALITTGQISQHAGANFFSRAEQLRSKLQSGQIDHRTFRHLSS